MNQEDYARIPLWRNYLIIFREEDQTYTAEMENEFTDMSNRAIVGRVKISIPQSFIRSMGSNEFLALVKRVFVKMQSPSCTHPEEVLFAFRKAVSRIARRLHDRLAHSAPDAKALFRFCWEQFKNLLKELWRPCKQEYVRNLTYRRWLRKDYEILSACMLK